MKISQSEKSRHFSEWYPHTFQLCVERGLQATAVFLVFHCFVVQGHLFTTQRQPARFAMNNYDKYASVTSI